MNYYKNNIKIHKIKCVKYCLKTFLGMRIYSRIRIQFVYPKFITCTARPRYQMSNIMLVLSSLRLSVLLAIIMILFSFTS